MALKWGLINRNKADAVTPTQLQRYEIQTMNEKEVQIFLKIAKETPHWGATDDSADAINRTNTKRAQRTPRGGSQLFDEAFNPKYNGISFKSQRSSVVEQRFRNNHRRKTGKLSVK